jgi:hypothetical protein
MPVRLWNMGRNTRRARRYAQVSIRGAVGGPPDQKQGAKEVWLEVPLEEADGWVAAYRVIPVEGRPVVAEIRLFPNERRPTLKSSATKASHLALMRGWSDDAGEWSAAKLGMQAQVPHRGVPSEAVRALAPAKHMQAYWRKALTRGPALPDGRSLVDLFLEPVGLSEAFREPQNRRPGSAGHGDLFYAQWAERYASAARASRKPIQLLVQEQKRAGVEYPGQDRYIRDVVAACRKKRFLTAAEPGKAGGETTPKTRRAFEQAQEKTTKRTRGRKA